MSPSAQPSRPVHVIKDVQSGEVTERPYTDEEMEVWFRDQEDITDA